MVPFLHSLIFSVHLVEDVRSVIYWDMQSHPGVLNSGSSQGAEFWLSAASGCELLSQQHGDSSNQGGMWAASLAGVSAEDWRGTGERRQKRPFVAFSWSLHPDVFLSSGSQGEMGDMLYYSSITAQSGPHGGTGPGEKGETGLQGPP